MPFMSRYRLSNLVQHARASVQALTAGGGCGEACGVAACAPAAAARTLGRWGSAARCQSARSRPARRTARPRRRRESSSGSAATAIDRTPALPARERGANECKQRQLYAAAPRGSRVAAHAPWRRRGGSAKGRVARQARAGGGGFSGRRVAQRRILDAMRTERRAAVNDDVAMQDDVT